MQWIRMSCSANSLGSKTQKPVSDRKITEHEFTFFVWCSRKHHFSTKRHKLLVLFYFALTKYRGPDVSTEYVRAQWVPYYNIHERSIFFFFWFSVVFFRFAVKLSTCLVLCCQNSFEINFRESWCGVPPNGGCDQKEKPFLVLVEQHTRTQYSLRFACIVRRFIVSAAVIAFRRDSLETTTTPQETPRSIL